MSYETFPWCPEGVGSYETLGDYELLQTLKRRDAALQAAREEIRLLREKQGGCTEEWHHFPGNSTVCDCGQQTWETS